MCSSGSEAAFSICFVTMSTGPAGELCTQRGGCLMTTSPPKPRAVGEQTGTSNHRQRAEVSVQKQLPDGGPGAALPRRFLPPAASR